MSELINDYLIDISKLKKSFNRAADKYDQFAILQQMITDRLVASFDDIRINPKTILDIGSGTGYGAGKLKKIFKNAHVIQLDISNHMLRKSKQKSRYFFPRDHFLCADANNIPLLDASVDIVFSNLMLQWCNNLEAVFSGIYRVLKPGGLFLFTTFGPDSLKELRESWGKVDDIVHVNIFVDMHDIGDALMRCKFSQPVLTVEHLVFVYENCWDLMRDLKNIGGHNINHGHRKTLTGKNKLNSMIDYYENYRKDNKLPATYEIIYGHAWRANGDNINSSKAQAISLKDVKRQLADHKTH